MSTDRFRCIDAKTLLQWMLHDFSNGELFGIDKSLFFHPETSDPFRMERYGSILETPLGVAAGPHTQLAQNILSAWLCGARYMELKTIQVLDELNVTKPCIDMEDEGYNCEWSQELKLDQSFDEYLKAFVLIYVLRDMLGLPVETAPGAGPGFLFNMSAGYNLEGIRSPSVQRFFDRMGDCATEVEQLKRELAPLYPRILELSIPGRLSDNLTVSTMHGCPPEEVEKIGLYFISERKYHTTVKLNPTLIGPERLRTILNTHMGFSTQVPDEAFGHDLKYPDGVRLIRNLRAEAEKYGVAFSLKLTNTLETTNNHQNLPRHESMVYMSGRALHPVSINLAERLQLEFEGALDISFSAGVDVFNVADVLACGLRPLTVCSDLLKPGGYGRMSQYLDAIRCAAHAVNAHTLDELAQRKSPESGNPAFANLVTYAADVLGRHSRYRKENFPFKNVKTDRPLPRFDCAKAPCMSTCPTGQDIPRYLEAVARGDFELAWKIILATNPFPNVQGMVCDHQCQSSCTRLNYDRPLMIREIKRFVAQNVAGKTSAGSVPAPSGKKVAIIGAGPTGLSCAHFLALRGVEVTIYEAKPFPGGMAGDAIPVFRLDNDSLSRDIQAILDLGVKLHTGVTVDAAHFERLRMENDAVYVAVGAQKSLPLGIPGETASGVIDQLAFLSAVRRTGTAEIGNRVIVIGAGNSAMDAARTARRLLGEQGEVTIVYRRTRREMPADAEEVQGALDEGVKIVELCAPEEVLVQDGKVTGLRSCCMRLEDDPRGGRPRPVKKEGECHTLEADTLIVSIGQNVGTDALADFAPACPDGQSTGRLHVGAASYQSCIPNVFSGGDAMRGASSLINAIGDGRKAAESMLTFMGMPITAHAAPSDDRNPVLQTLRQRQARRLMGPRLPEKPASERLNFALFVDTLNEKDAREEAHRCLQCDLLCNICATVCPNRANLALCVPEMPFPVQVAVRTAEGVRIDTVSSGRLTQPYQIVNLADACNECGNCATFCPSSGAPYKDKPKVHLSRSAFEAAPDGYFLAPATDGFLLEARCAGKSAILTADSDGFSYTDATMSAHLNAVTLCADRVELKADTDGVHLSAAVEMVIMYRMLASRGLFTGAAPVRGAC